MAAGRPGWRVVAVRGTIEGGGALAPAAPQGGAAKRDRQDNREAAGAEGAVTKFAAARWWFFPDARRGVTPSSSHAPRYDLLANACHDLQSGLGKDAQQDPLQHGTYRVHVHQESSDQWYEIQDLHVSETMPQLIGLSESLLTIYQRRDA